MAAKRWWRRSTGGADPHDDLWAEVERLRQENMRLRLQQQRPRSISSVTEQLAGLLSAPPAVVEALEAQDEAHHVLAQAESMRRSLLDVLDGLSVASTQMRRQLSEGLPLAEIDRRVTDRRQPLVPEQSFDVSA